MTKTFQAENGLIIHVGDVWKFTPNDQSPVSKIGTFIVLGFDPETIEDHGPIKAFHLDHLNVTWYGFMGPQDRYELVSRL